MSKKPKGIARAAKERRRAEAEQRNARTPLSRTRLAREGSVEYRANIAATTVKATLRSEGDILTEPEVRLGPLVLQPRNSVSQFRPDRTTGERGPAITPRPKRRTPPRRRRPTHRAAHIAPRRIGDGIKPNHLARAVDIHDLFPRTELLDAVATAQTAVEAVQP